MELYFLDKHFGMISTPVDQANSVVWSLRYQECGTFSVQFPLALTDQEGVRLMTLVHTAVYVCDSAHCGRIETIVCRDGSLEVGGRLLECLLYDRVANKDRQYTGTVDAAAMAAVTEWAPDVPVLYAQNRPVIGTAGTYPIEAGENLGQWLHRLLYGCGASFTIQLNTQGKPVLSLVMGTDRSLDNTGDADHAIFSEAFGNITALELECYRQEMGTRIHVVGPDDTMVTVDQTPAGETVREMYKKTTEVRPGHYSTTSAYKNALQQYGRQYLDTHGERRRYACRVQWDALPVYGTDYQLGDLCEIHDEALSLRLVARLTALDVVWEGGMQKLYPFFGDEITRVRTMHT